jgi:hypothetical protein
MSIETHPLILHIFSPLPYDTFQTPKWRFSFLHSLSIQQVRDKYLSIIHLRFGHRVPSSHPIFCSASPDIAYYKISFPQISTLSIV